MLARIARASYGYRRLVVAAWIVVLIVAIAAGSQFAGKTADKGRLPGTDSQRALDLARRQLPQRSGAPADIVFANLTGHRPAVDLYLQNIARLPGVTNVDPLQISVGGRVAVAPITLGDERTDKPAAAARAVEDATSTLRRQGVDVEFSGDWFGTGGLPSTEAIGLLAAVIVLLLAFGSVVAMGLPIVTALFGLGITVGGIGLVARFFTTPGFTTQVATMIGIGVGIDYALFIVTRYRDALDRLGDPHAAVVEAMTTAGRAVLFAGCTVIVSLLGMFLMGLDYLDGLAVGTSLAVGIAVAAALTLLPALLGFLRFGIDRLRVGRRRQVDRVGMWQRWAGFVQRRPWPLAIGGFALLLVLALPALYMHLGSADEGNDAKGSTTRQAFDLVAQGFGPGANGPMMVVVDTGRAGSTAALPRLEAALRSTPGVALVSDPELSSSGHAALITVTPTTGPQNTATAGLIHKLRDTVIPDAVAGSGLIVHVGGETAGNVDFANAMSRRLPLFFGGVLGVSFLLLLLVFRSVLVPLKAVLMNLLSIGAAYGVMVAVFQWGRAGHLIGVTAAPIEPWAPMMLFAIVFGLSMDYEVFLLSAIREHYDATGDNASSVTAGLASTARVIAAAATVMVVVFGSFLVSDARSLKEIGLGLAVAIAIDATIVRVVLVPATMELLGRANWWLPAWLERLLPRVQADGPVPARPLTPAVAAADDVTTRHPVSVDR